MRIVIEKSHRRQLGAIYGLRIQLVLLHLLDEIRLLQPLLTRYLPEDQIEQGLALVRHVIPVHALGQRDQLVHALDEQEALYGKGVDVLVAGELLLLCAGRAIDADVAALGAERQQLELAVVVHGRGLGGEALVGDFVVGEEVLLEEATARRLRGAARVVRAIRVAALCLTLAVVDATAASAAHVEFICCEFEHSFVK